VSFGIHNWIERLPVDCAHFLISGYRVWVANTVTSC
jgi:hypothetical protein